MEGEFQVEVNELEPVSTCLFEMWPAESTFDIKTAGNRGHSGDRCELQQLEFLSPPEGAESGGKIVFGDAVPQGGYPIGSMPPLTFRYEGCDISVSGELNMSDTYGNFDDALAAQDTGDPQAFFVRLGYLAVGSCPLHPFSPNPGNQKVCGNTYSVRVEKL